MVASIFFGPQETVTNFTDGKLVHISVLLGDQPSRNGPKLNGSSHKMI